MVVQVDILKRIPYFLDIGPSELSSIAKLVFEKKAAAGEILLLEGETTGVLYFVISGVLKVFKISPEGKEQILSIARPGDSFNDVTVLDSGPNPASVQAIGPVILCGIRKGDLETILRDHPQVVLNVIKVLAGRIRYLVSLVEDLSFKHVVGRVAKILLEYAGDGTGSGQRLTQQDMAAMAGTVREVVGRSLKTLQRAGAIRLDRHRIVVTNKDALRKAMEAPA